MNRRPPRPVAALVVAVLAGPVAAADHATLCLDAPYEVAETPAQVAIGGLVDRLREVQPAYPSLVRSLDTERPTICLIEGVAAARGYFDLADNLVGLHAGLTEAQSLAVLIHEMRHIDQASRGLCPADSLAMEEVARATFAMEADAGAVTAHVAYEMRETGTTDIWEALVGFERYRDIAVAYDEARATTGSVARAMGAAFEQWYASDWRRERYYVATCSAYLDRIDETHLVPSYGLLDEAYFASLCLLPDGTSYACDPPDGARPR